VKLVAAVVSREYLSDLKVVIQDPKGKTYLSMTSNGPWTLVKLPEGEYIFQVSTGGQTVVQRKSVGKGFQVLNFLFKP
jgi:hypothetical protein